MTNEMKLLMAFIDASGFDIEATEDIKTVYRRVDIMASGDIKEKAMPESIIRTIDYKVTKKEAKPLTFDKIGDVISIPTEAFAEAAKRDIARGIDTRSCDSNLQQLMRVFAEIKQ